MYYLDDAIPLGYQALIEMFDLQTLSHFRKSYALVKGAVSVRKIIQDHVEIVI